VLSNTLKTREICTKVSKTIDIMQNKINKINSHCIIMAWSITINDKMISMHKILKIYFTFKLFKTDNF